MAMSTCIYFTFINFLTLSFVSTDERKSYNSENEKRWNTPPELIPEALSDQHLPQPRFLPFSASFTVNSGSSNSHSLSIGGTNNGISLSQSQSMASSAFGNVGSSISTSQSSSFSAGLSGLSLSDSNAFNLNHPSFGGQSNVNSNSFAIGQASSSSNGKIDNNNRAMSSAQSSVGSWNSLAASGLGGSGSTYQENNNRRGKPSWTNISPNYNVGGVYMTPGVEYSGRGGLYGGHNNRPLRLDIDVDDSQYQQTRPTVSISDYRPSSVRNHRVLIDEHNANVHRYPKQQVKPSLQVLAASASAGSFISGNHGQQSHEHVNHQTFGQANSQSSANSGSAIKFPNDNYNNQNIQREFIRSRTKKSSSKDPINEFFTDLSDTVSDLFEF